MKNATAAALIAPRILALLHWASMTPPTAAKRAKGGQPRAGQPMERMLRVRLSEAEWNQLEAYAEREDVTMSEVVRQALAAMRVIVLAGEPRR